MAQQTIDIGSAPNDGTGDPIRDAFDKCNDNFTELYTGLTGLLDFKGSTDCSANPNYPAASKGDFYLVSVAGKIGGASGIDVEVGDSYFATADNAGGTQAAVGTSWTVVQGNVTSYMPKTGGTFTGDIEVPAEVYGPGWNTSNEAPTKNDVYDKIESLAGGVPTTLDNLSDVDAPSPANGDVLTFNSGAGEWEPQAPAGGAGSVTSWKQVVRAATTANGTLASAFENGDTIDGVVLATGDRILIKNQTTATENGIYTVNASGAPTRATDADTGAEMLGAIVPVSEGTVNADRVFQCTTDATITLGSTNLTFRRYGTHCQIIKLYTGLANAADTINVNNTGYVDVGAAAFMVDLDEFLFTEYKLIFSAGSNQAGQTITAQLTYQFSPTSPIHTGGNDVVITNSFGTFDSGWKSKDDAIVTGLVAYSMGLKGSNSTVDLTINSAVVILRR